MNNAVFGKSFLSLYLVLYLFIDSFIAGKISIFMLICSFMFLCTDSFIDSFIIGKTIKKLMN